jgi:DNA topoisomerase-2
MKVKEYLADQLTHEWSKLDNKVRFIEEIISGKLIVQNRKKADILQTLQSRKYASFKKPSEAKSADLLDAEADNESAESGHGYDYLLSMPIWNLTQEKVQQLEKERNEKQAQLDELLSTAVKDLWVRDLDEFLAEWKVRTPPRPKKNLCCASSLTG